MNSSNNPLFPIPLISDDELVRQSQQLLEKLHYPWEMMPLMYVILKGANGDVAKAHQRIDEGMGVTDWDCFRAIGIDRVALGGHSATTNATS